MLLLVSAFCLMFSSVSFAYFGDSGDDDGEGIRNIEQMDSHSPDPYNLGRYIREIPLVLYHNADTSVDNANKAIGLDNAYWVWASTWTGKKYGVTDSEGEVNTVGETYLLKSKVPTKSSTTEGQFRLPVPKKGHILIYDSTTGSDNGFQSAIATGPTPVLSDFHNQPSGIDTDLLRDFDLDGSFRKTTPNVYGEEYYHLVGQGDMPLSSIFSQFDNKYNRTETYKEPSKQAPHYDSWQPRYSGDVLINREEADDPDKSFYRGRNWSNKLGIANNNRATLEVPGQIVTIIQNVDLTLTAIPDAYRDQEPGTNVNVKLQAWNNSKFPVKGTNVRWCVNDGKYNWQSIEENINFAPDETKYFTFSVPVKDSSYTILVKINQEEDAPAIENDWDNNITTVTIVPVQKVPETPAPPPAVTGNLKLTAKGQNGVARTAGTAKWTDTVTATLTAQRPPVPSASSIKLKGGGSDGVYSGSVTITDYRISSATLSVPKKHPNFTFGNPIELSPMQYSSVSMPTGSRTSTQTFQEDWSMAGAKIYSQIQKRMLATQPKYYSIKANYTVRYKVQWSEYRIVCTDSGCFEVYNGTYDEWRTASYSASANLLVNGTGVDSRAQ